MKYTVPQFIDVEDKIFGPITTRQFLILLVTAGLLFVTYKLFDFALFLIIGIPELIAAAILAFVKINGQPFHFFLLNLIQTSRRPMVRAWNKELTPEEIRMYVKQSPPPPAPKKIVKAPVEATKLADLSLLVNTGGVYNPEE